MLQINDSGTGLYNWGNQAEGFSCLLIAIISANVVSPYAGTFPSAEMPVDHLVNIRTVIDLERPAAPTTAKERVVL